MSLNKYNEKRNFNKTKEPKGTKSKNKSKNIFIVQHHLARKDHYDLRFEYNGELISFAVPKGPSYNPKDKRLAIRVENHPLSYQSFEGIIPENQYGAGLVMLWDKGTYEMDNKNFENKVIKFYLNGKRLKGGFALIKTNENNYLLIKEKDEFVNKINIQDYNTSIKSGKTFKELKTGVTLTHPERVIIKKDKITKQDIFNYYDLVKERMMPFLNNRIISTIRKMNNETVFMKHLNNKNLGTKKIKNDKYYYIKNENNLLSEVQMNSYEFHIWGCNVNDIRSSDILMFDLDPDEKLSIEFVRNAAKDLKKILDKLKLKSYVKTSGNKGYHIFVPFSSTWKTTEELSYKISNLLVESNPDKYTINIRKNKRKNKIFIDYLRNKKGASCICPYSLKIKTGNISCPISWSEINKIKPDDINISNIKSRLKKVDPWQDFYN